MHIIGLKFLAVLLNVKFPYLSATSAFIKAKSAERASSKMYFLLLKTFSSFPFANGVPTAVAV